MNADDGREDSGLFLSDKTGALLMLNKHERKLIKALLTMVLNSESGKTFIVKKLGAGYVRVAENLLDTMS
jgi:hypothetical protein